MKPFSLFVVATAAAALSTLPPARAQVPEGHAVVSTLTDPGRLPGTGGLFYVSLRHGKVTPVTNLPVELTGKGHTAEKGANCLAWRPSDGHLFVGESNPASTGKISVWFVKLTGSKATATAFPIGRPASGSGAVRGLAMLNDGRVLVAASSKWGPGFLDGPMKDTPLAIVDDKGSFTPLKVSHKVGYRPESVAVDAANKCAYLAMTKTRSAAGPVEIWSVELATGKTTVLISIAAYVPSIQVGPDGAIYLGGGDSTGYFMSELREVSGKWTHTRKTMTPADIEAFCFERVTDRFVVLAADHPLNTGLENSVSIGGRDRKLTRVTGAPTGGWGVPTGIAINPSLETYGTATAGANTYRFVDAPNPGGLPLVGNLNFSLTVEASGVPTQSVLLIGTRPGDVTVVGARFLVDMAGPTVWLPLANAKSVTIPLGIPNVSAFRGASLFVQSLHIDAKGLAATKGLTFTVE